MKASSKLLSASALIVLLTVVAYLPVLRAGFIWDDDDHLTANPAMTAPDGLRMIWSSLAVSRYYPLTLTNFWIQHRLWGLNPMPYHLVNIVLHATNGVLLFLVLRRLRIPAPWLGGALWALHPVNVESVAWITELKNTQSSFFFFCGALCFLRFETQGQRRWYLLALICAAGAMLSKPSTVVLPMVLLLCSWWERGKWRTADLWRAAPFFALALAMSALTITEQRGHIERQGGDQWALGMAERLIVAGKSVWFYVAKVLWPVNLTFVYPRWTLSTNSVLSWLPLVALGAAFIVLWTLRRHAWGRAGLFGFGFFVTALLPVLGFFDVFYFRYSFVADHFQYLAGPGIVVLASTGLIHLLSNPRRNTARTVACGGLLLTLSILTWQQTHIYRDPETLWRDTVRKNPNSWMAHNLLGSSLLNVGEPTEAIGHFQRALEIKPDYAWAHNNLGVALQRTGAASEAAPHFQQALQLKPDYADAWYNLAIVLEQDGKIEEATSCYERAAQFQPDLTEAWYKLGVAYEQAGKVHDAKVAYERVLRFEPNNARAHNNLGIVLQRSGNIQQAMMHWQEAVRLDPDFAEAHNNLGAALMGHGQLAAAATHFEQALKTNPRYAKALFNLASILEISGRRDDAIKYYQQALQVQPKFAEAQNALERLSSIRSE